MTTEKQIEANQKNAQLSTGPTTEEGKAVVVLNPIKHGIFVKDLIITCGDGKENEEEYKALIDGLVRSLHPDGQMQSLLVEKIAVDFWRLKRVLRFETGSIRKYLDMVVYDYYNKKDYRGNKESKTCDELDEEIKQQRGYIDWNSRYIEALKKGIVSFNKPEWEGEGLKSEIDEDLFLVAEGIGDEMFSSEEYFKFEEGKLSWEEILAIFRKAGNTDQDIANALVIEIEKRSNDYLKRIKEIEQEKLKNKYAEEVKVQVWSLPNEDNAEKVIKYEKAIQKSIFQNLALLKRLQMGE